MAKKKAAPKRAASDRVAFQLRLRAQVHERLSAKAAEIGASLNELIDGILEGAVEAIHPGRAVEKADFIEVHDEWGYAFLGKPGKRFRLTDRKEVGADDDGNAEYAYDMRNIGPNDEPTSDEKQVGKIADQGELWFGLNFSGSPVMRK